MRSSIFVIDDERTFDFEAVYARTSDQAFAVLRTYIEEQLPIKQLWLDHDLGGDDTVRGIVSWLEELGFNGEPAPIETILIHTANPVARGWMRAALERYYKTFVVDAAHYVKAK